MSHDTNMISGTGRVTVAARDALDGQPLDRDAYAACLAAQADPEHALEGDPHPDRLDQWVVEPDDGPPHPTHGAHASVRVMQRAERHLLPLLTAGEATSAAQLLDELAGVYAGEPLGQLARDLAVRLYERLGI